MNAAELTTGSDQRGYADLVDLVISVNREIAMQVKLGGVVKLTATEVAVMRYTNAHAGCSPSQVAVALGLLRSNVSPTLRSLESSGLIERVTEGRDVQLRATTKAVDDLRLVRGEWTTILSSALEEPPTGLRDAIETLRVVEEALIARRPGVPI